MALVHPVIVGWDEIYRTYRCNKRRKKLWRGKTLGVGEKNNRCAQIWKGGGGKFRAREKRRFDYNGGGIDLDAAFFTYLGGRHVSEAGSVLFFGSDRFHDSLGINK